MTVEGRDNQTELTAIRSGATAAGTLLALGILAMTVGLIRSEAASDLRTLSATGATSITRRTLTAATGGALALLGVMLGAAGAYLALLAGYHHDLGTLSRVPLLHLTVTIVGLPLTAAVVGWVLAGREPSAREQGAGSARSCLPAPAHLPERLAGPQRVNQAARSARRVSPG
jgi:putative ABC transport system permease protein